MQIISHLINHPVLFSTPKGDVVLSHPTIQDIPTLVTLLKKEGLDVRRLVGTTSDSFSSMGHKWVEKEWDNALVDFRETFPEERGVFKNIHIQSEGILAYKEIPLAGTKIVDPFHMAGVENETPIESLVFQQLRNIILAKADEAIVSLGRLLEVGGSVELVSLWTHKGWRRNGLAARIIRELLQRTVVRPIFSYQRLQLVPFYLRQYGVTDMACVCNFTQLPSA